MANRHLPDIHDAWLRGAAAGALAVLPWMATVMLGAAAAGRDALAPL
ncbi:MAG: hypothetical protein FJ086_12850, partial [Deltaproteobacteria bacterium]|nr:hypothetical protein [Deltaproteobacteria bacterium]